VRSGGPVTITHPDITRYFMTIPEAAQLVIQAGAMSRRDLSSDGSNNGSSHKNTNGRVYVLDMGEPVKIIDLARRTIELSGLTLRDEQNPDGDIELMVTGLRPGEKLYEELLIGDNPQTTDHPRIMQANEAHLPWAELETELTKLDAAIKQSDVSALRAHLEHLVVGYKPNGEIVDWVYLKNKNS
jgi:FlaA1/EpsC-like NDP-sugar epimerase